MLTISSLSKSYGTQRVLDRVDIDVGEGEILALLGPNGAGKTTLVSIVVGLRRADAGAVHVAGVDALAQPARVRPLIGFAPQQLGIYPTLSARRNLVIFGELAGLRGSALHTRIDEVASALGLGDLLDRRAGVLSGGQQRRLHTAMALVHQPRLLFLDEPTVGADVESRRQILALVKEVAAAGCTTVYATHYLPEIEDLDARVTLLNQGRIVANGSVSDLVRAHSGSKLRLTFRGPAPTIPGYDVSGSEAIRAVDDPGREAAQVFAGAEWASRLESVEIFRPSLEDAYVALTGSGVNGATTGEELSVA